MLSIDYDVLRLFSTCDWWTPATVAQQLHTRVAYARVRLESLLRQQLVFRTRRGQVYKITDTGKEVLADAKRNRTLQNPRPWITRVRMGIDTAGHELQLNGRAAIPSSKKPEMSYEMDIDAYIDAKRAGLLDEILQGGE